MLLAFGISSQQGYTGFWFDIYFLEDKIHFYLKIKLNSSNACLLLNVLYNSCNMNHTISNSKYILTSCYSALLKQELPDLSSWEHEVSSCWWLYSCPQSLIIKRQSVQSSMLSCPPHLHNISAFFPMSILKYFHCSVNVSDVHLSPHCTCISSKFYWLKSLNIWSSTE